MCPALELRFTRAARDLLVARHVEPAGPPVPAEVLPEIRELQRRAQRVRRSVERVVAIAADAQHEPSHRIRRAAAVVEHVGPRSVARRHGILTERAQQIVEQRQRKVERANRVTERERNQLVAIRGPAIIDVSDVHVSSSFSAAARWIRSCHRRKLFLPFGRRRAALVGDVVRDARERIHRRDVRPHRRGQQARRDGKVFVVRSRQRLARRVRARQW